MQVSQKKKTAKVARYGQPQCPHQESAELSMEEVGAAVWRYRKVSASATKSFKPDAPPALLPPPRWSPKPPTLPRAPTTPAIPPPPPVPYYLCWPLAPPPPPPPSSPFQRLSLAGRASSAALTSASSSTQLSSNRGPLMTRLAMSSFGSLCCGLAKDQNPYHRAGRFGGRFRCTTPVQGSRRADTHDVPSMTDTPNGQSKFVKRGERERVR